MDLTSEETKRKKHITLVEFVLFFYCSFWTHCLLKRLYKCKTLFSFVVVVVAIDLF